MLIYRIVNKANDKQYVGQTISSMEKRFKEHCSTRASCPLIHKAIKKYGKDNFEIKLIQEVHDPTQLDYLERHYIGALNTMVPNGYNLSPGGNSNGKHSEETKEKIRRAHLGIPKGPMSSLHKEKLRIASTGKSPTKETRTKLRIAAKKNQLKNSIQIIDQNNIIYRSIREASRILGIAPVLIRNVLNGKQNRTKKYSFKYHKEN